MTLLAKKFAERVSFFFHPAITGVVFVFGLFLGALGVSWSSLLLSFLFAVLLSFLPQATLRRLVKNGRVNDYDLSLKSQRRIFFRASLPFFCLALVLLWLVTLPEAIILAGMSVILFVAVYYFVSPHTKISLHVGGLSFGLSVLGLAVVPQFFWFLFLVPLLAWARVKLRRHTWPECFWGAGVGLAIPLAIFSLLG